MKRSYVQWPAVSTWRGEMMEPPQKGMSSPADTRPTCREYRYIVLAMKDLYSSNSKCYLNIWCLFHLPRVFIDLRLQSTHNPGQSLSLPTVASCRYICWRWGSCIKGDRAFSGGSCSCSRGWNIMMDNFLVLLHRFLKNLPFAYHWPPPTLQGIRRQWCASQSGTLLSSMDPNLWWAEECRCHKISRKRYQNLFPWSQTHILHQSALLCWKIQMISWFFGLHCLRAVAIPEKKGRTLVANNSEKLHSFWPGHPHWNNYPDGWKMKYSL